MEFLDVSVGIGRLADYSGKALLYSKKIQRFDGNLLLASWKDSKSFLVAMACKVSWLRELSGTSLWKQQLVSLTLNVRQTSLSIRKSPSSENSYQMDINPD
ncbi:MAG: hypothetical protein PW792_10595 [Acidobacteriaceae bacterium]|nr:hypothetical protein [Acidobacteriaceae bacterium]